MSTTEIYGLNQSSKKKDPFQRLGLDVKLSKSVKHAGYRLPTPIQRQVIPLILQGCDIIATSRTGSGKTGAFLLPVFQKLECHQVSVGIRCIIFEPTRELAVQVYKVAKQFNCYIQLRLCVILGGVSLERQFHELSNNPDVVIATPGRFHHLMLECGISLSKVEIIVLDEADQMLELGLEQPLQSVLKTLPKAHQTILMSATLPSFLVEFTRLLKLHDNIQFVQMNRDSDLSPTLDLWFVSVRPQEKMALLLFLLRKMFTSTNSESEGVLIFASSRHAVELIHAFCRKAQFSTGMIYGAMDSQVQL